MKKYVIPITILCCAAFVLLIGPEAMAQASNVATKGSGLIDFISGTLGPIILGLGLIMGAGAMILGIPGAVQKLTGVFIGGVLLTSISSVVSLIESL